MSLPFFKYAGGKRRLLPHILPLLRPSHTYVEPFLGGGAAFLAVASRYDWHVVNDANPWVAATWRAVKVDPEAVIQAFLALAVQDSREFYYSVRRGPPAGDVATAAWFLYVNKAGWNGLLRVNSRGECNTPYGDGRAPVVDAGAIRAASIALQRTTICCGDFEKVEAPIGSQLYCDPPYLPLTATASFTGYSAGGFTATDQIRLARWCRAQADRGCRVVLSNAGNEDALAVFAGADQRIEVSASRVISCKGAGRQPVREFLFAWGK